MISLRTGAGRATRSGRERRWAAMIAVALTCASFTAVSLALRAPVRWMTGTTQAASPPERVVLLMLPPEPSARLGAARQMTTEERDSALDVMSAMIQDLAAARVPTQGERDAAKEAMLKMRNSGRILLVPPDNTGGLITLPLPRQPAGRTSSTSRTGIHRRSG